MILEKKIKNQFFFFYTSLIFLSGNLTIGNIEHNLLWEGNTS